MTEYILTKQIEEQNAKIKVYRPVLSKEDHERRMKQIHKAASTLLKEKGKWK